jgi:23S rRNA (uracil1939-C5)-methyltransferase
MKKVQVCIESVAFKGYGVARIHGKVVFIPHTVTGDQGWIEMTEEKKKYSMGRLIQIVKPSPWRVNPLCPSFGSCGGCQWQDIDYFIQCKLKREILEDVLKRLGGVKESPPIKVIPSLQPYGYRIRAQLKVKGKTMGYFQEKSHRMVDIQACPIAHPLINQMLSLIRERFLPFSRTGEIEINVSPDESKGVLILPCLSLERGTENVFDEFLQNDALVKGIVITQKERLNLFGDPTLNFTIPWGQEREKRNFKLRISPGSFSQVNPIQNQTLIQTVLQLAEVNEVESALDLYCGIGNLTLPLAMGVREVLGIEENRRAIEDARFNAKRNGIRNCEFIQGRVEDVLMSWRREKPDLVVLDPPRTGCKTVLDQVVRLKPQKVVYASCEPTTFSRDLRLFYERGYSLQRLCLIDMFPQTYHMEVVGLLQPYSRVQGV